MKRKKENKTIYLHIGTEKTGTTTIQNFLWQNRNKILKQGYIYPKFLGIYCFDLSMYSSNPKHSVDIRRMKQMNMNEYNKFQKEFPQIFVRKCKKMIKSYSIILSSELLSSRIRNSEEINKLYELLHLISGDIKIIIYLRRQDLFFTSLYSTAVKSGCSEKFSDWIRSINYSNFDYYQLLNFWSSVFKKENIIVRVFNKNNFKDNNLIDDFISIFPIEYNNLRDIENKNISLNVNTLRVLRIINKIHYLIKHEAKTWHGSSSIEKINNINKKYFKNKKLKMNKELFNYITNKYRESNRLVAKEYFNLDSSNLF